MNLTAPSVLISAVLVLLTCRSANAAELQPDFGLSATFSIVAVDPETGVCGAAVASKYPAVGKVVPYVRAGVGAFCTQHWHHPPWGEHALDLLQAGHTTEDVLAMLLRDDQRRDKRQLAIIDMRGRAANRNPSDADPSGIYWGAMSGRFYACQGNTLAGREVLVAMAAAYEETTGSLTDRLMAALVAADCAGGDHRGRLAAGIRVAKTGHDGLWFELYVDNSDDAVIDLLNQFVATEHPAKGDWTRNGIPHPCRGPMASLPPTTKIANEAVVGPIAAPPEFQNRMVVPCRPGPVTHRPVTHRIRRLFPKHSRR